VCVRACEGLVEVVAEEGHHHLAGFQNVVVQIPEQKILQNRRLVFVLVCAQD